MKIKYMLIAIAALLFTFFSIGASSVYASEDVDTDTVKTYNFCFEYYIMHEPGVFGEGVKDYTRKYNLGYTSSEYVLIIRRYTGDHGYNYSFVWYSPKTGDICDYIPSDVSVYSHSSEYLNDGDTVWKTDAPWQVNSTIVTQEHTTVSLLGVSNSAVYHFEENNYDTFGNSIYMGGIEPVMGFDLWNDSNDYDYESVYSSSIISPNVRYSMICWDHTVNNYVVDIRFLLPGLDDNTGYYVEIWADIPVGYDSNGNVVCKKRILDSIQVSTLLRQNNVQVPNPSGNGWVTENRGTYYAIYGDWPTLMPYVSANDAIKYGGVTFYLRSSYPVSSMKTMVSDYVYFTLNPGDVKQTESGWQAALPDIYIGKYDTFNENGPGQKKDDDINIPNSGDIDYVGGVTDDPGIDYTGDDWEFSYSGNWTVDELEDFVNSGFGLDKPNGLISLIGSCLNFLPKEVMTILMFLLTVLIVVGLIRIFG